MDATKLTSLIVVAAVAAIAAVVAAEAAILVGQEVVEIDGIVVLDGPLDWHLLNQNQNVAHGVHALVDLANALDDSVRALRTHVREHLQYATSHFL